VQPEKSREPRKEWIMVVDIGCLLGEESIKDIRVLQGLRGTRLIIPRIGMLIINSFQHQLFLFINVN
jgi:hypothetical protein